MSKNRVAPQPKQRQPVRPRAFTFAGEHGTEWITADLVAHIRPVEVETGRFAIAFVCATGATMFGNYPREQRDVMIQAICEVLLGRPTPQAPALDLDKLDRMVKQNYPEPEKPKIEVVRG